MLLAIEYLGALTTLLIRFSCSARLALRGGITGTKPAVGWRLFFMGCDVGERSPAQVEVSALRRRRATAEEGGEGEAAAGAARGVVGDELLLSRVLFEGETLWPSAQLAYVLELLALRLLPCCGSTGVAGAAGATAVLSASSRGLEKRTVFDGDDWCLVVACPARFMLGLALLLLLRVLSDSSVSPGYGATPRSHLSEHADDESESDSDVSSGGVAVADSVSGDDALAGGATVGAAAGALVAAASGVFPWSSPLNMASTSERCAGGAWPAANGSVPLDRRRSEKFCEKRNGRVVEPCFEGVGALGVSRSGGDDARRGSGGRVFAGGLASSSIRSDGSGMGMGMWVGPASSSAPSYSSSRNAGLNSLLRAFLLVLLLSKAECDFAPRSDLGIRLSKSMLSSDS